MDPYLSLDEKLLSEILKDQGYVTGTFGKWHLSNDKNHDDIGRFYDPQFRGFDEFLSTVKPEPDHDPFDDPHHVEAITEHSLEFIDKHHDKPFFLWISHHVVHRPLIEQPDLISKYENKPGVERDVNNPVMGAMIERADSGIGQVLDKLSTLGLDDNTIVIFFSDNGGLELLQSQEPLRGGKAMVFEGGIRVPLAIQWPGVIEPGSVSHEPVISDDFVPTFMEMAAIDYHDVEFDGQSLMPILTQNQDELDREALYWHYPHYHHLGYKPGGAIRMGDYKLIEWYEETLWGQENQISLFNIKDDISESEDIKDEYPRKAMLMRRMLHEWRNEIGAQEMTRNAHYDEDREDYRLGAM